MKSSLSFDAIMERSYQVGDQVMYAHLQAADIKGYNRTATITKVGKFDTYEIRDDHHQVVNVDCSDIAPLSSRV